MKEPYIKFEESLAHLLKKARKQRISVKDFLKVLSGKGKTLLIIFLSLGFSQIPGIAVLFGLLIAYCGIRIAMGNHLILLPRKILRLKFPKHFLVMVLKQLLGLLKWMKRWSAPRYGWASTGLFSRICSGCMIAIIGLSVASSPPIPLVGLVGFLALFSIAIGLLNEDGLYNLIGYFFTLVYLGIVILLLKHFPLQRLIDMAKELFH